MNKFCIISRAQFDKDFLYSKARYENLVLPTRATRFSAGYDFIAPCDYFLSVTHSVMIPTGIRVLLDEDKFLAIVPRSSLGFKYRMQLDNTVGIIDADYANADNEGHIWIKITNDNKFNTVENTLVIRKGQAFAQGIIMSYFKTDDDNIFSTRTGGFGSTDKKDF